MDAFLTPVIETLGRQSLFLALHWFYIFVLVVIRLAGLMSTAPLFSQSVVPVNVRVLMVVALSLVLTPAVQQTSSLNADRFDLNRDGFLTESEVPPHMFGRVTAIMQQGRFDESRGVPLDALQSRFTLATTSSGFLFQVFAEYALGFLLGLGVTAFLSGLQLAGQIIDQQLGLEFGQVVNPDLQGGASVSSQLMFMYGGVVLLAMQPVNGHVLMLGALIETFDALPVGEAVLFSGTHTLFNELIHKSLLLGVQVAGPVLAVMSLVSLSLGFLGHSVPQINQMVVGFPVRSLVGMLVLLVTLTDTSRVIADAVPIVITEVQLALASYR